MGPQFVHLPSFHVTVSKARPMSFCLPRALRVLRVVTVCICVGCRSIHMCYRIKLFVSLYVSISMSLQESCNQYSRRRGSFLLSHECALDGYGCNSASESPFGP